MAESPYQYHYWLDKPYKETAQMRVGGYTHQLVLGKNGHEYSIYDGVRRGVEWEKFKLANPGRSILNKRESECAMACAESLLHPRNREALELLTYGETEKPIAWQIAGRECTGRPDVISDRSIVDLKVTASAKPEKLRWHALRQAWHAQLAWYEHCAGGNGRDLYIVAVEPKEPYMVCAYRLEPSAIESGTKLWRSWFELLRVCEQTDTWPGYSDCVVPLEGFEEEPELIFEEEEVI